MKRLAFALLLVAACDKSTEQTQPPAAESEGLPPGDAGPDESLTAAACQAQGGNVIGDIGNGAIFKADYVCESNGQPPVARIEAEEGGPLGVEGSVCCGP